MCELWSKTANSLTTRDFFAPQRRGTLIFTITNVTKSIVTPDGTVATVTIRVTSLVAGSNTKYYLVEVNGLRQEKMISSEVASANTEVSSAAISKPSPTVKSGSKSKTAKELVKSDFEAPLSKGTLTFTIVDVKKNEEIGSGTSAIVTIMIRSTVARTNTVTYDVVVNGFASEGAMSSGSHTNTGGQPHQVVPHDKQIDVTSAQSALDNLLLSDVATGSGSLTSIKSDLSSLETGILAHFTLTAQVSTRAVDGTSTTPNGQDGTITIIARPKVGYGLPGGVGSLTRTITIQAIDYVAPQQPVTPSGTHTSTSATSSTHSISDITDEIPQDQLWNADGSAIDYITSLRSQKGTWSTESQYIVKMGDDSQVNAGDVINNALLYETPLFKYHIDPNAYFAHDAQVKDHHDFIEELVAEFERYVNYGAGAYGVEQRFRDQLGNVFATINQQDKPEIEILAGTPNVSIGGPNGVELTLSKANPQNPYGRPLEYYKRKFIHTYSYVLLHEYGHHETLTSTSLLNGSKDAGYSALGMHLIISLWIIERQMEVVGIILLLH